MATALVRIERSTLLGSPPVTKAATSTVQIASSQLNGAPSGTGYVCVYTYSTAFLALSTTCT